MINKFFDKAKEVLTSASEVIPAMPLKEQAEALRQTAVSVGNELTTAAKVTTTAVKAQINAENKAKAIAFATMIGSKIGKGSAIVGNAIGTTARTAVEVTKAVGTPLVQGVKEGYSTTK